MPLISVVTPAKITSRQDVRFLLDAYESLCNQQDIGNWEWEWLIQEDGEKCRLLEHLPDDERIRYAATGASFGAASNRNLALSRANGEIIRNLDHDDLLLPRGLAVSIELLTLYPSAQWCAGERITKTQRLTDSSPNSDMLDEGIVARNRIFDLFEESRHFHVHCAGIAARPNALRQVGGWSGLPRSEDTSMLCRLNYAYEGAYSREPTFVYRKHASQSSSSAWSRALLEDCHSFIVKQQQALCESSSREASNGSHL